MTPRFQGCSAPSASERVGSGTTSSGSITRWKPSPWQRSQAPCGELKEKIRGSSSGIEVPHSRQANCSEKSSVSACVVDHLDFDQAGGEAGRGLDRLGEAAAQVGLHHQPVDDDRDVVFVLLVEDDLLVEAAQLAVDLDPRVALEPHLLEQFPVLAFAPPHDRRHHHEFGPLLEGHQPVDDLLLGLAGDLLAALRGSAGRRSAPRAGAGSRRSRSPCRRSSAGCARSSSGRSRSPARAPRSSRRRASPSGRGTGARRRRATRRSAAAPRRRSCRRRGSTCPSPRAR